MKTATRRSRRYYRGSIDTMTVDKLSLSFESSLARRIRRAAKSSGQSVSAFVADAVEHRLKLEAAESLIGEWEAEHGEISEREMAAVRKRWRG